MLMLALALAPALSAFLAFRLGLIFPMTPVLARSVFVPRSFLAPTASTVDQLRSLGTMRETHELSSGVRSLCLSMSS